MIAEKMKYYHLRLTYYENSNKTIDPKGGTTVAIMELEDKKIVTIAKCSNKDNFSKKLGRKITSGRMAKHLLSPPRIYSPSPIITCFKTTKWVWHYGKAVPTNEILEDVLNQSH